MPNFIKLQSCHSRILKEHLYHTRRFNGLAEEEFSTGHLKGKGSSEENSRLGFVEYFDNKGWLQKLAYMALYFQFLDGVKKNGCFCCLCLLQGTRFLARYKKSISFWKMSCYQKKCEMFPLLLGLGREEGQQQVFSLTGNHLEKLQNQTEQTFLLFQHKCIVLGKVSFFSIFWLWTLNLRKKEALQS